MKPDQLEQFVLNHKDEFDDLEPRTNMFKEIDTPKPKVIQFLQWNTWTKVAAAALLFSFGFVFNELFNFNMPEQTATQKIEINPVDSMLNAFEEMQVYYASEINSVTHEIILLSNSDEVISAELDMQMQEFNDIFNELKRDLNEHANEEEVIEAMILNYRVKLRMLEDMKTQLNATNKIGEEAQYETIDI